MRYFGLQDWLDTLSQNLDLDLETLQMRLVDSVEAILALRQGGGKPASSDEAVDVAAGLTRLLFALTHLRPFKSGRSEQATLAAAVQYAANRGYLLDLAENGLDLVGQIDTDSLDVADVYKAVKQALRVDPNRTANTPTFRGIRACISYAVTNPTEGLRKEISYLTKHVDRSLRDLGCQVFSPDPKDRIASDGTRTSCGANPHADAAATNEEIFVRSIERVTGSNVLVIIGDPQNGGSNVEREWALRLGIPVIEFEFGVSQHPHRDAPNRVTTITVDRQRINHAVEEFRAEVARRQWAIFDQRAEAAAFEVKNATALAYLKAAWDGLARHDQQRAAHEARISHSLIEGLLSNGVSLELASELERRSLEAVLHVPNSRGQCADRQLSTREIDLLSAAAEELGVSGRDIARVVHAARDDLVTPRLRSGLRTLNDAKQPIRDALRRLDRDR